MTKKSKKYTLTLDVEETYRMIGICSHHIDYRLVWGINNELNSNFIKAENLFQIFGKKGVVVSEHSYYTFFDDENEINYYLIKNKSNNHYLIPEKVEFDYLFFICGDHYDLQKNIINKLKNVSSVLTASELDTSEIKSTDNINF
ncbi:MAG: IPExxxVDY family protein [Crocinitomicaceae bacterium]